MPVTRKQQILAKTETSEGVSSSPGSSDAVLVFDPQLSDTADIIDRVPAGPTLSRDFTPIGRKTRTITFASDFRGSGDTSIPVDEPDWAKLIKSCGYKPGTLQFLVTSTAPTNGGYELGEIVSDGVAFGVVVSLVVSGALFNGTRMATSGGGLIVALLSTSVFTAPATVIGASSLASATVNAVSLYGGVVYQPTSEKVTTVTTGAWTGTAPVATGEVLSVESGGVVLGAVQIVRDNATGFTNIDVTQLFGTIANGNTLRSAGNGTATISATPTMKRTPSLTIAHNFDGRRRDLLGARGTFTCDGDLGAPMQFKWSFTGDLGVALDAMPLTTTNLGAIRPPRLLGAILCYGLGAQVHRLPTKRVAVDAANQVNQNLDVNRAGGATGSNITDRDPSIQVTVDDVHSAVDWESARDNQTTVRFCAVLGSVGGNVVGFAAPQCQVTEVARADADGVGAFDVTLKPRRFLESGDDELFIFQL